MRYINSRFTYFYLLRSKIAAVANVDIDIADISGSEMSVNIDIDPALAWSSFTDPEGMKG